jgi:hypothetical protein
MVMQVLDYKAFLLHIVMCIDLELTYITIHCNVSMKVSVEFPGLDGGNCSTPLPLATDHDFLLENLKTLSPKLQHHQNR